jgi:hypothetical protein
MTIDLDRRAPDLLGISTKTGDVTSQRPEPSRTIDLSYDVREDVSEACRSRNDLSRDTVLAECLVAA